MTTAVPGATVTRKRRWPRRLALTLPLATLAIVALLHFGVLPWFDRKANAVLDPGPYPVDTASARLHRNAFVADLHADALLWGRDLRRRNDYGQVDLPRLVEGGVDLQVFSVVSQVPRGLNYLRNRGDSDSLPLLFIASLRAPSTWFDARRRALAQAAELRALAAATPLTLVTTRGDLDVDGIKGLLALEGMHALGDTADTVEEFVNAGFRMFGLAHFFDNAVAGSAHGVEKYGLTPIGRRLIPRLESLGITVDLAHASPAAMRDTLALATRPVVVSHGGVAATCPGPRNLDDAQLRAIADNGGVVGIGYWPGAICGRNIDAILRAIRHVIDVAGINHVGLGSDFDGYVSTPFDTRGLPRLTEALLRTGYTEDEVRAILGGNVRRVLAANLPS